MSIIYPVARRTHLNRATHEQPRRSPPPPSKTLQIRAHAAIPRPCKNSRAFDAPPNHPIHHPPQEAAERTTRHLSLCAELADLAMQLARAAAARALADWTEPEESPPPTPRRAHLREAFRYVTKNHPDQAELTRDANSLLDAELTDDPDQTIATTDLLFTICKELDIEIDLAQLPDEYLFPPGEIPNYTEDINADHTLDPRATSPP